MKNLVLSLETVHKAMKDEDWDLAKARLKRNVTTQFSRLAEIVNYDGLPCYELEDDDDYDDDNDEEDNERRRRWQGWRKH